MKNSLSKTLQLSFVAMTLLVVAMIATPAVDAQNLTLTADGQSLGFTLSTFATMDPGAVGCCGPMGVAVAAPDRVLVFDYWNQTRYVFHDADGQTKQTAITSTTTNPGAEAYAAVGGYAYGGVGQCQPFAQWNTSGLVQKVLTGVPQTTYLGMWGNPTNGHFLATTCQGTIIDIDPNANGGTGSSRTITSGSFDGITISADGTTVYGESSGHIYGYTIATGALIYDSGYLPGNPDGTGVIISNNNLNGMLIVNFNGNGSTTGKVSLLNPTNNQVTDIATGGTRGDYVAPDISNGTLFLDYSDKVYRLSCGPTCSIGQGVGPCSLPAPQCQPR